MTMLFAVWASICWFASVPEISAPTQLIAPVSYWLTATAAPETPGKPQEPRSAPPKAPAPPPKNAGASGARASDPAARYALRTAADKPTNARVSSGLEWLARHQDENGSWDCDEFSKHDDPSSAICDGPGTATHDVGVTALAVLAFLGDGNTPQQGKHKETVRKAVDWLVSAQDPKSGIFGSSGAHDFIYDHAIATYAICEAHGMTKDDALRAPAQRGIDYLEFHRNEYGVWRYLPNSRENDTSVTGWCVSAYLAADAGGLAIEKVALRDVEDWMKWVSDDSGMHGYSRQGEPSARKPGGHRERFPNEKSDAMTAIGLFTRCMMDPAQAKQPIGLAATRRLAKLPPLWRPSEGHVDMYYWYYGAHALFQVGGAAWKDWQKKLAAAAASQHADPRKRNYFGSWDPVCVWGEDGGRVYSTAMMVLTLEAEYRYPRSGR